jgi:hypothetical protein
MGITGEKKRERERWRQVEGRSDKVEVVSKIKGSTSTQTASCTVPVYRRRRQADACSESNLFAVGTPERGD